MFKGAPVPKTFPSNETQADLGYFYAWQLVPSHHMLRFAGNSPELSLVSNGMLLITWSSFCPEEMGTEVPPFLFSALSISSSLRSYFPKRSNVCCSAVCVFLRHSLKALNRWKRFRFFCCLIRRLPANYLISHSNCSFKACFSLTLHFLC